MKGVSGRLLILHICSGPSDRLEGLASFLSNLGLATEEVDILNCGLDDICNDEFWLQLEARLLAGTFAGLFGGPPCRTFSESREIEPGPPKLRWHDCPWGVPENDPRAEKLRDHDFDLLATDNLIASRTARAGKIMLLLRRPFGFEQPFPWKGGVCMCSMNFWL